MTFKKLHFRNSRQFIGIRRNLNSITVALVHHDPADIFSKYLRQKCQHILLLAVHSLFSVPKNSHPAFKESLNDQILDHGIILHLIHDQMAHTGILLLSFQPIFQIQNRIHILIAQLSFFILNLWKRRKTFLSQETVVQHIEISCLIHPVETALHSLPLLIRKIESLKSLHLINEIFCHCIHSGKQWDIHEFKVKKLYDLLLFFDHTSVFHITEVHKVVLKLHQISFHTIQKIP